MLQLQNALSLLKARTRENRLTNKIEYYFENGKTVF